MQINNPSVALVTALLLISLPGPIRSREQGDVQRLAGGATVSRGIAENETHTYHIPLKPGEFLRILAGRKTKLPVGRDGQDALEPRASTD